MKCYASFYVDRTCFEKADFFEEYCMSVFFCQIQKNIFSRPDVTVFIVLLSLSVASSSTPVRSGLFLTLYLVTSGSFPSQL